VSWLAIPPQLLRGPNPPGKQPQSSSSVHATEPSLSIWVTSETSGSQLDSSGSPETGVGSSAGAVIESGVVTGFSSVESQLPIIRPIRDIAVIGRDVIRCMDWSVTYRLAFLVLKTGARRCGVCLDRVVTTRESRDGRRAVRTEPVDRGRQERIQGIAL
jgi:hypothetical protein